jgi:hypothetical protein
MMRPVERSLVRTINIHFSILHLMYYYLNELKLIINNDYTLQEHSIVSTE